MLREDSSSKQPEIWEIILGIVFILIGAAVFFLFRKSKSSVEEYKKLQLEKYKQENPKFKGNYEQAKLILPWMQRFKLCAWPIIGISLIAIGITMSTGLVFQFFKK